MNTEVSDTEQTQEEEQPPIACIREETVYQSADNKWVHLRFDHVEFRQHNFHGRYNVVVENKGVAGVVVVPIRSRSAEKAAEVALIRQFRYPVGQWSTEFPRGFGTDTRPSAQQAREELREETRLDVHCDADIVSLSVHDRPLWTNTGISDSRVEYFAARDVFSQPNSAPLGNGVGDGDDGAEVIDQVVWLTLDAVGEWIRVGRICDHFTICAYALLCA
ncbi:hypothetical protein HK100_012814 [Physocladia obscura]|uniref:Nudix hydrolase domain-containing protein n=1 Tax=Physocladia obscura TaxID=109957 RepID=A0AAD5T844_9FUNG|nr:hypothetical protein HK100_012814 [Physocladia obscura]